MHVSGMRLVQQPGNHLTKRTSELDRLLESVQMAMSEQEWLQCSDTNLMFATIALPSEAELAAFNLAICNRIRNLISDEISLKALDALERSSDHITVPAELALAAQEISGYFSPASPFFNPSRNWNAARAIAHAVCRSLTPGSFHYWADGVDNARLVALYCQWAAGSVADPGADEPQFDANSDEADLGSGWLRKRAEKAEASAQCDLIRGMFSR